MGPVRDWSPREEPPGRGGGYEQKLTSEYPAVDCRRKEVLVRVPGCSFSGRLRVGDGGIWGQSEIGHPGKSPQVVVGDTSKN